MEDDDYVRNAYGWIDDFSAPPGAIGHPVSRHIMLYTEFNRVLRGTLRELKLLKFSKQEVEKAMTRLIDEVYDENVS